MREQALLKTDEEHNRELQSLCGVQRHQRNAGVLVITIGFADQRRMIEELVQRLSPVARVHGCVHQFLQVLDARQCVRRVFLFQLLDVARPVDQEFQQLGGRRAVARLAESFNGLTVAGSIRVAPSAGFVLFRQRLRIEFRRADFVKHLRRKIDGMLQVVFVISICRKSR